MAEYTNPVAQLLTLGDALEIRFSHDYLAMGFTEAHIPELIQMATDAQFYTSFEDTPEVWSPIHAWRVLAHLKAVEAVAPLLAFLERDLTTYYDDVSEELSDVFAEIGVDTLPLLENYMKQQPHTNEIRALIAEDAVVKIGNKYPATRSEAIRIITDKLSRFAENDPDVNGFLVGHLVDLHAVEALDVIRQAFEAKSVDPSITGNLGEVEVELGLSEKANDYAFDAPYPSIFGGMIGTNSEHSRKKKADKSKKSKRKQSKASQKKNRKRK